MPRSKTSCVCLSVRGPLSLSVLINLTRAVCLCAAHLDSVNKALDQVNAAVGEMATTLIKHTLRLRQKLRPTVGPPSYFTLPATLAALQLSEGLVTSVSTLLLPSTDVLYMGTSPGAAEGAATETADAGDAGALLRTCA
jgi:hypothetical protein